MVGPRRPLFVLFGSSIVQASYFDNGWAAILADIYARKADILLRGYAGWNSRRAVKVLHQIFPMDEAIQPSLVIVYFGGNDSVGPLPSGLGTHVPLPEYIENMRTIATHLKVTTISVELHGSVLTGIDMGKFQNLPKAPRIIFLSCPPVNEEMARRCKSALACPVVRTNELCEEYSNACVDLCKEMEVKVIDLYNAIKRRKDWSTACFNDGIHFSPEGSMVVAQEIIKVLKEAEWVPSLHWKSIPAEFGEDSECDVVAADGISTINISELTSPWKVQWE